MRVHHAEVIVGQTSRQRFFLSAAAVLSLLAGVRFERWEPVGMRGGVASG